MVAAGFWRRCTAWTLDAALVGAPVALLAWPHARRAAVELGSQYHALLDTAGRGFGDAVVAGTPLGAVAAQWLGDPALRAATQALQHSLFMLLWPPLLGFAALGALYHVAFESAPRQATPGQRALGLRVVDADGTRIGRPRALLRHVAGALSWLTLNIGHALVLLRPDGCALHDLVAGTRVVQDSAAGAPLPAWARAWLGLQALLLVCATGAWVAFTDRALRAGLDAALGL
jgi:uncharacterized RDD family membrane protein YckC